MDLKQPFIKYIVEPLLAGWEDSNHPAYLQEYETSQFLPREQLDQIRLFRLKRLLTHAYENCPFYTARMDNIGFHPNDLTQLSDITALPVLTKADIQNHLTDLTAKNYPKDLLVKNQTGGSSGAPLQFFVDQERMVSRKASTFRHDRWCGWDVGVKTAVLWGHHRDFSDHSSFKARFRESFYERRIFLDTSQIILETFPAFNKTLRSFQPKIYLAYANAVFLYARYLKEHNLTDYHRPDAIITSAELLTDDMRELIQTVFDCPVFNRYGCRETSVIASECDHHTGMHLNAETLYLETIVKDHPAQPDETGAFVITDLLNFGMPLIRYQIGDMGRILSRNCPCGRELPLIELSGGRTTDFIVTPDDSVVSGAAMTIYFVATTPGIAQAQLHQKMKDFIVLNIVKGVSYNDETERLIQEKVKQFFGDKMRYEIHFTDAIPPTASGKHCFSISELDPLEYLK